MAGRFELADRVDTAFHGEGLLAVRWLLGALDRHWFAPASLRDLAIVRIVAVASQLFLFLPPMTHEAIWLAEPENDPAFFGALPALKVLLLPLGWGVRPDVMLLQAIWGVAIVAGLCALVGLYARPALLLFAAANTVLIAGAYSYGEVHHPEALMALALWVLALGPSAEAFSLDAFFARLRAARRSMRLEPVREEEDQCAFARWPLRTIQWLFVLVYLSAGATKLARGGIDWMNGYTLSYYLAHDGISRGRPIGVWLSGHPDLCALLSIVALVFELTFALALLPSLTVFYIATGVGLHTGIYLAQHAPFFEYIVLYSAFLDPLRRSVARWLPRRRKRVLSVVYDGLCPLCVRNMVLLEGCDWMRRLRFLDVERDWALISQLVPGLSLEDATRAMHVVNAQGGLERGFFAFRALAHALPPLWLLAPVLHIPGADALGPKLYALVAENRGRHKCRAETCAV